MSSVYLSKAEDGITGNDSSWLLTIQCTLHQLSEAYPAFERAPEPAIHTLLHKWPLFDFHILVTKLAVDNQCASSTNTCRPLNEVLRYIHNNIHKVIHEIFM